MTPFVYLYRLTFFTNFCRWLRKFYRTIFRELYFPLSGENEFHAQSTLLILKTLRIPDTSLQRHQLLSNFNSSPVLQPRSQNLYPGCGAEKGRVKVLGTRLASSPVLNNGVFIPKTLKREQTVRNFPGKVSWKLPDFPPLWLPPNILEIPGMEFKFLGKQFRKFTLKHQRSSLFFLMPSIKVIFYFYCFSIDQHQRKV